MSNITIKNPNSELSVDQRSTIVKLLNSKAVVLADEITDHDGFAVEFEDGSLVTYGDLAECEAIDPAKPVGPGNRHYPVVCGLTKGQASGVIAGLLEYPDRPKAGGSKKRFSAKPKFGRQAASSEAGDDRIDRLEAAIAMLAAKLTGEAAEVETPAKPEPAKGHRLVKKAPAKPVGPETITVEDGSVLEIAGDHFVVSIGKNGRPYLAKVES